MQRFVDFKISPELIQNETAIRNEIIQQAEQPLPEHFQFQIIRRNIDARQNKVWYVLRAEIFEENKVIQKEKFELDLKDSHHALPVHIIGTGPCGYFAALELLRHGYKPILLERGKDVQSRRKDLRAIQQDGMVNPHSNYCFGEGGAGTYSDGKLYTRSTKRGNIQYILELLVAHGASEDILVEVHPHIGSNKLPQIIQNIRQTITQHGGEIHFNHFVDDIVLNNNAIQAVRANGTNHTIRHLILATGHSARDIFELLDRKKIEIECKDFALGVRIEHPQSLIDFIQYKQSPRQHNLPAAPYALSCQVDAKGVFSFCMCPGGLIVPSATSPGEIVVNGMSLSRRDSPYANSGMVTSVDKIDFAPFNKFKSLQGMYFQQSVEQKVFESGDGSQRAPAQRLMDFLNNKISADLPSSSYIPGLISSSVSQILPKNISHRLKEALQQFGRKMPAYLTNEALVVATESRTSSPVRIPRHHLNCQHIRIQNLYPAGEGAGYAGGILSAAMDGIRVANAIVKNNL